jgi:tetratricopeptide (TPR) repeat protein
MAATSTGSIGKRLRRLRLQRGLSQKELAEPKYTHAYVSTIEAGRRRPSPAALEYFAKRLQIEPDELASGRSPDALSRLELMLQGSRSAISSGRYEEAHATLGQVRREAKTLQLDRFAARADEMDALSSERQGRFEEAIELYDRSLTLLAAEPPTVRAYATGGKARCLHSQGDISYAIYILESFIEVLRREKLEDPTALCLVQAPLVLAYFDAGMQSRAAQTASELLALAPRVKDAAAVAAMYVNVARMYMQNRNYADADASARRAEDLFRELDLQIELGVAHLARGYVLSRKGDLPSATEHLQAARETFESAKSSVNQANAYCELARVERLRGRSHPAKELLDSAIHLLSGEPDLGMLAWAHRELGLCQTMDDPTSAEKHYRQAIEHYERSEEKAELAITYGYLGDLLRDQGDQCGGCDSYRLGIAAIEGSL